MKPELIDDWKAAHKFWSIRLGTLATIITSALVAFPDVWHSLPEGITSLVPDRFAPLVGCALFIGAMVARVVKQPVKEKEDSNGGSV